MKKIDADAEVAERRTHASMAVSSVHTIAVAEMDDAPVLANETYPSFCSGGAHEGACVGRHLDAMEFACLNANCEFVPPPPFMCAWFPELSRATPVFPSAHSFKCQIASAA